MLLPLVNRYDRDVLSLGKHTEDEISPILICLGLSLCFAFITNEHY